MNSFFASFKDLIFPAHCLGCERQLPSWKLPLFCDDCLASVPFIHSPYCTCCGVPFQSGHDHLCGHCITRSYSFKHARAALLYKDPVVSLISNLKFKGKLTSLSTLVTLAINSSGFQDLSEPDIIIPVPLHVQRLRERGFNQAATIAHGIFRKKKRKIAPILLVRNRATIPQTGLNGKERRKNLSRAFSVKQPEMVKGKRILLVDDVLTTGSTVNECAKTLMKCGAQQVEIFTLSRAI